MTEPLKRDAQGRRTAQRLTALAAAVASLVLAFSALAAPAQADAYGTCTADTGCRPDSYTHNYCLNSAMSGNFLTATRSAMAYLDTRTTMSTPENGCDTDTDVLVSSSTAFSDRGDYLCLRFASGNTCNSARVRLNPDLLPTLEQARKTACHEFGHSVGLAHGNTTDCMINGSSTLSTYNQHHVDHINARA